MDKPVITVGSIVRFGQREAQIVRFETRHKMDGAVVSIIRRTPGAAPLHHWVPVTQLSYLRKGPAA